ncbi:MULTISPECIES: flagellar biosynthetic protein FliQ [Gammaproteobacteria]|uniref:flagellar biosynthetic protein FliQ n=1 Tax=Gammaproteobacteria TaxID=1236 RepID=UPI001AD98DFE|nr:MULTISPECIES: flagellar biosynthetic protein FliQ [Gammaproteobacteria]MBO9480810.1 flagellar biosynthetic protein FliQ [Salinisphaera sp. G21_0]MBO9495264.1 flagellar biosynthetic protein FliQ [Thalassotalea sp. G20_0]
MSPDDAVYMFANALRSVSWMALVLIAPGLVVGLLISIIQAATQVTEQTLSFLPRLLITLLTLSLSMHWLVQELSAIFTEFFVAIVNSQ